MQQFVPSSSNLRGISRDQSRGRSGTIVSGADNGYRHEHNLSSTLGAVEGGLMMNH